MSADRVAQREAMQAVTNGVGVAPYGTGGVRVGGDSLYGLIPPEVCGLWGVEQGDELMLGYEASEQTLMMTPERVAEEVGWASQFVGD
jgi:hypothetical protein